MEIRTIKGIDEETWAKFKALAAKSRMTMGELFNAMLEEYRKEKYEEFWEEILSGNKIICDKDASEMEYRIKKLRKEGGFRA